MMPGIGDNRVSQKEPIQREVHIYKLTNKVDVGFSEGVFYRDLSSQRVKVVRSNKKGTFEVQLEEGSYSLFIKEDIGLFASIMDGDGNIFPVKVEKDNVTDVLIEVNYLAIY